ncbi:MAG: OmpA family protein [Bacteroidales bacterium]|nr:OmpA family protein [Bacteroidales bacterium]
MKNTAVMVLLLIGFSVNAQKNQADTKYKRYEYNEAIPLYQQYLENHADDEDATRKLALALRYTNNIRGAIEAYRSLIQLKNAIPDDYYDLVQMLRINGNLSEARTVALQYQKLNEGDKASNLIASIDRNAEFLTEKDAYIVTDKTSQVPYSVFAPTYMRNGLLVTAESARAQSSQWTGRGFTKIFFLSPDDMTLTPFAKELMSDYNDGPAVCSPDGETMYFTTVNKQSVNENDINTSKLQISAAILQHGKWTEKAYFTFNDKHDNAAHPALSHDGKVLVFASDRPGGKGGMDLYYCTLNPDKSWSEPVNMRGLNTSENEIFPSFDPGGNIYFASNGLPGLGGLDIFFAQWNGRGFGESVNVKAPINSSYDDFAITTDVNRSTGYFSTNRFENPQTDDLAYFEKSEKQVVANIAAPVIKIIVTDKYTATPLPYVLVTLKNTHADVVFQGMTDPDGALMVENLPADDYRIQGVLNDITTTLASITPAEFTNNEIVKKLTHNDPRFTLSGIVTNSGNDMPVEGVTVSCMNTVLNRVNKKVTAKDGKFFFQLEQASDFKVSGEAPSWLSSEVIYETTKGLDRSKDLYVTLKLSMQQPAANEVIRLDKIYYDYDKCDIKPRAAEELDRLVKLMHDFPDMIIELSSHTDSRGSDDYNIRLSQCRADAAVKYIISKGIALNRLVAMGYGETKLVNGCANNVTCSEQQHQENRRTEFKIVSCSSCPGRSQ